MAAFDFAKVKDPTFFKENVLNAHASFRTYASREEYRTGSSSLAMKLDGIWKFAYAKNYTSAIPGFEKTDYDCSGWDDIHVPAHIQMEGYDIPQYANVQYPWDGREEVQPGEIPQRFNPVASYVKYFELPESMQGKPVHIEFEGVESGMALWLNGSYVGYTEDSFSAHAFDLTSYLQPGVNKLAVQVFKWTSSSWCEDQDFFRFSGIFRSVWLYAIPTVHLEDLSVKTLFAGDDFAHSTLEVALQVEGKGAARLTLRRSELEVFSEKIALNGGSALFSHAVENPHLWSAEDPALYELEIELLDDAGHLVEVTGQKVGFRKFELKNNRMLLNGKRIVFKGANRHEFSSITGRAVGVHTHEELLRDIITMKQNNINAIRTSHYQNQDALYDLCDEYGLYLIAENNLESHGTWDIHQAGIRGIEGVLPNDKPEWKAVLFDRMNSTYQRDKNHPAVLIWSLGNESFGGETLLQMPRWSAALMTPVWCITKVWSTIPASSKPPISRAICTARSRTLKNIWHRAVSGLISSANILMLWATPTVLCTSTRNLPTRRTAAIRAALSGITSTSPSGRKTATASGSKPTAAISVSVLPTIISAETALPTVVTVLLLPRCRRSSSAIRISQFPSTTLASKSGTRTCSPLRMLSTALHCCIVMESCISNRN